MIVNEQYRNMALVQCKLFNWWHIQAFRYFQTCTCKFLMKYIYVTTLCFAIRPLVVKLLLWGHHYILICLA